MVNINKRIRIYISVPVLAFIVLTLFMVGGCEDPLQTNDEPADLITNIQFNYNKWSGEIYLSAKVLDDNDGIALDSVFGIISDQLDTTGSTDTLLLYDTGLNGDIMPGDGVFARSMEKDSTILAAALDSIEVALIGFTVQAYYGTAVSEDSADFDLTNFLPEVLGVSQPLIMYLPCSGDAQQYDLDTLVVTVSDSNGLDDIQICYLNFELPNGNLSSGSPIQMYDDGYKNNSLLRWDEVSNDGKYSHLILIDNNSAQGVYKTHYYARDIGGLISSVFSDSLIVLDTCGTSL